MARFYYLLFLFFSRSIIAQRDAEAEAICQPFLTSPQTSPLASNKRNIVLDEEGEFYCELVLQDRFITLYIIFLFNLTFFLSSFLFFHLIY